MTYYPETAEIKQRFFQAIDALVKRRVLRGKRSFATQYDQLRTDPTWTIEAAYLTWMVRDFAISARWLLTGEGEMFAAGRTLPEKPKNKPKQPK